MISTKAEISVCLSPQGNYIIVRPESGIAIMIDISQGNAERLKKIGIGEMTFEETTKLNQYA